MSLQQVAQASFPRDEALHIAGLLAFTGGYLEAYAWIVHRVFANAQSANLVFLWVNAIGGEWEKALHYVPSLLAFSAGVVMACWLRWAAPLRAVRIGIVVEIVFLFVVAILHNRLPDVAGTLGISLVAAFQMVSFPRVEGWTYNSAMVTSNFRQTIEALFPLSPLVPGRGRFAGPTCSGRCVLPLAQVLPLALLQRRPRVPTASPFP